MHTCGSIHKNGLTMRLSPFPEFLKTIFWLKYENIWYGPLSFVNVIDCIAHWSGEKRAKLFLWSCRFAESTTRGQKTGRLDRSHGPYSSRLGKILSLLRYIFSCMKFSLSHEKIWAADFTTHVVFICLRNEAHFFVCVWVCVWNNMNVW